MSDPMYARSSLTRDDAPATPKAPPATPPAAAPAPAKPAKVAPQAADEDDAPDALESPESDDAPDAPEGADEDEIAAAAPTGEAGGPSAEAPEAPAGDAPAELTPEQRLAEADKLLKLAKDSPEDLLKLLKIDAMSTRFAKLASEGSKLRRQAQELEAKTAEVTKGAQQVALAHQFIAEAKEKPVDWLYRLHGADGVTKLYKQLTQRILHDGKAPQGEVNEGVLAEMKAMRQEIQELRAGRTAAPQNDPRAAETDWRNGAVTAAKAESAYGQAASFYGDELADAAWQLARDVYEQDQRILTPAEALGMLTEDLVERFGRAGVRSSAGTASKPDTKLAPSPSARPGPKTLTTGLHAPVAPDAEEENLPDDVRMKRIAARHSQR